LCREKKEEMNKCKFCNGNGYHEEKFKRNEGFIGLLNVYDIICEKCHGTGELDWIEEIRGKRLSIAKRILSQHKILEELKKRVANEHQQKLQAFYEGCVPV
jgi:RecJ-like exonuclease